MSRSESEALLGLVQVAYLIQPRAQCATRLLIKRAGADRFAPFDWPGAVRVIPITESGAVVTSVLGLPKALAMWREIF